MANILHLIIALIIIFAFAHSPQAETVVQHIRDAQNSPYLIAIVMLGAVAYLGFYRSSRMGFTGFIAMIFAVLLIWNGLLGFSPANPYGTWGRATGLFSMGLGALLIWRRLKYLA